MGDGPSVTDHTQYKYPVFPIPVPLCYLLAMLVYQSLFYTIPITFLYHMNLLFISHPTHFLYHAQHIFMPHPTHFYSTPNTFLFHTQHIFIPHPTHFYTTSNTYLFRIILSLIYGIAISTRLSLFQGL